MSRHGQNPEANWAIHPCPGHRWFTGAVLGPALQPARLVPHLLLGVRPIRSSGSGSPGRGPNVVPANHADTSYGGRVRQIANHRDRRWIVMERELHSQLGLVVACGALILSLVLDNMRVAWRTRCLGSNAPVRAGFHPFCGPERVRLSRGTDPGVER